MCVTYFSEEDVKTAEVWMSQDFPNRVTIEVNKEELEYVKIEFYTKEAAQNFAESLLERINRPPG